MVGGEKIQTLALGGRELVVVKDLSELRAEESSPLLKEMASKRWPRRIRDAILSIAANHGQLLEKLRLAAGTPQVARLREAIEERLFRKPSGDHDLRFELRDLSRGRAMLLVPKIIDEVDRVYRA